MGLSTEDKDRFGEGAIVYCKWHSRPHDVGWCDTPLSEKIALGSVTIEKAYKECRIKGFPIV